MGRRKSLRALALVFVLLVLFVLFGKGPTLFAIEGYQAHVSPHLHGVVVCRFTPTCSHYGHDAIARYGLIRGGAKAVWRVARCGPWTPMGTVDPP